MSRLSGFKDRHQGKRCVIVANGPSLLKTDLSLVRSEITFGLNKIFLGIRQFKFYPRYYVAINPLVISQSGLQIKSLNCVKFLCATAAKGLIDEDALTIHLHTGEPPNTFSEDLERGINQGHTVTYAALQIAYFLGFSKVVLIGLDHRFAFSGAPNQTREMLTPDPNHFHPDYFTKGQLWQNPDLARSEASYRLANRRFEQDGRMIIDATVDGACTVFPKMSLSAALI
jgi:hypothetical protein